jgi:hypothetical protein
MNKKKERTKGFFAGFLLTILLSSTIAVLANTGTMLEVFFSVNHVVVNGNRLNLSHDEQPFISGGRTFLPVRVISEALGQPVNWDGNTGTVYIGSQAATTQQPAPQVQNQEPSLAEILSRIEGTWVDKNHYYAGYINNWDVTVALIRTNGVDIGFMMENGQIIYDGGGSLPPIINHLADVRVELVVDRLCYFGVEYHDTIRLVIDIQATEIQEIIYKPSIDDYYVLVPLVNN